MTTPGLSEAAPSTSASASAPGRLDFLGGVSDYSGATVLQAAISLETKVTVTEIRGSRGEGEEEKRLLEVSSEQFGEHVGIDLRKLERAGKESFRSVRRYLSAASAPQWVYYAAGCLVCLCIQVDKYPQTSVRMHIASQVPPGQGVSSSASLEIAIIRALMAFMNVEDCLEDMEIAKLAQRAENEVVGASCGIMDQIACSFGSHGSILPIACMECSVANPVYLPDDAILVGFPTKVQHHLSGGESPYQRARTATAMAAKIAEVESLSEVATVTMSRFEKDLRGLLPPGKMSGSDFIEKYGAVGQVDELSEVSPEVEYPVADAFEFAVQANFFAGIVLSLLESAPFAEEHNQEKILRQIGEIMLLQHNSYTKIGLGHVLTDSIVQLLMSFGPTKGIYGARSSGGGSGGTIVILCHETALPIVERIAGEYKTNLII